MKLIIFDLDGTLLDTVTDITTSINLALKECGLSAITEEACKYMLGSGVDVLVEKAVGDMGEVDIVKERYLYHYSRLQRDQTKPYDGILEALQFFKLHNIPMAVLSNKQHPDTVSVVEHYFGPLFFHYVMGKKNENKAKPAIDGCLEIEHALGIHDDIVYVGDTNIDMQTATNAGYFRMAVTWGFRKKEELMHFDRVIEHPSQLVTFFEEQR